MTISEKIYHYLRINDITAKDFAEKLGISRASIQAMLAERNRYSQDFFEALIEKYPDIDLNALVDKNVDVDFLKENKSKSSDSERINELEKTFREIKKIISNTKI